MLPDGVEGGKRNFRQPGGWRVMVLRARMANNVLLSAMPALKRSALRN